MSFEFYKLTGAGNDFIALAEPASAPSAESIRRWCRRRLSLGADGLFVLSRRKVSDSGMPDSGSTSVRMRHFNADGGAADLCVNGVRCAARLAFELDWVKDGDSVTVVTDAGTIEARCDQGDEIRLTLDPGPYSSRSLDLNFTIAGTPAPPCWQLTVGVPHLVVPWAGSSAEIPVAKLGARLRSHSALGAAGANVNFATGLQESTEGIDMRTFERGVEGETLACGSGVLAVASVAVERYGASFPLEVTTRGGHQFVISERSGRWELCAHAALVARGELF